MSLFWALESEDIRRFNFEILAMQNVFLKVGFLYSIYQLPTQMSMYFKVQVM